MKKNYLKQKKNGMLYFHVSPKNVGSLLGLFIALVVGYTLIHTGAARQIQQAFFDTCLP